MDPTLVCAGAWLLLALAWLVTALAERAARAVHLARERRGAEARALNAMMMIVDWDLEMRGIEHPAPPYIPIRRHGKRAQADPDDAA